MKKRLCVLITAVILIITAGTALSEDSVFTLPAQLSEIGEEAFMGDNLPETLVLPDGLTSIGARAFKDSSVQRTMLPDGLSSLGEEAFDSDVLVMAAPDTAAYETACSAGYLLPALNLAQTQTAEFAPNQTRREGFTAPAGCEYQFTATGSADGTLTLFDSNGDILAAAETEDGQCALNKVLADGETVFIAYTSESADSVTFSVGIAGNYTLYAGTQTCVSNSAGALRLTFTAESAKAYGFAIESDAQAGVLLYGDDEKVLDSASGTGAFVSTALEADQTVVLQITFADGAQHSTDITVSEAEVAELTAGVNTLQAAGEAAWGRFSVTEAGTYRLYSNDTDASSVRVFSENFELLGSDAGSGYGNCFAYTLEAEADDVYYIECTGTEQLMIRSVGEETVYLGEYPVTLYAGCSDTLTFTAPVDNLYRFSAVCETETAQCAVYKDGALLGKGAAVEVQLAAEDAVTIQLYSTGTGDTAAAIAIDYETYDSWDVRYRALLIGEVSFESGTCKRNEGDVNIMRSLLSTVNGGCYSATKKTDLTKAEVQAAIASAFADADDNDVSLFFYASHGLVYSKTTDSDYYGGMKTYDGGTIKTAELAEWLSAVPGKVIVFVGTCGSGGVIEEETDSDTEDTEANLEAQAEAIADDFAAVDEGIYVEPEPITLPNGAIVIPNRGELRTSKFEVITAASGDESSWGIEGSTVSSAYNFFALWIRQGISTRGVMPADTDGDGLLTTNELYTYVADCAANTPMETLTATYYQHPQVYPENSDYVLFTRE